MPSTIPYPLRRKLSSDAHQEVWSAIGPDGPLLLKRARDAQARAQLQAEAALLRRLPHPCLVPYHSADPAGWWLLTEHVAGTPAHRWAIGRPQGARIEALARLVEVVAYLHSHGVTHGDIRPASVLVSDDGVPHLINLGRTADRRFGGTPGYTAPEQLLGEPCAPAADTYALGATAYRLLTGQPAFRTTDPAEQVWRPLHSLPLPPSTLAAMPRRLEAQILRMLARRPEARPRSLAITARAIRTSARDAAVQAPAGLEPLRRTLRQRLVTAIIGRQGSAVAVIGPPDGRRAALLAEVLDAARREQATAITADATRDGTALRLTLQRGPFALALDPNHPDAARICADAAALGGLVLLAADRVPAWVARGDRLYLPGQHSAQLQTAGLAATRAADIERITQGRPAAVRSYLFRRRLPAGLSTAERGLLLAAGPGGRSQARIAARMGCSDAALRALAAPLIARGLLEAAGPDGLSLRATC